MQATASSKSNKCKQMQANTSKCKQIQANTSTYKQIQANASIPIITIISSCGPYFFLGGARGPPKKNSARLKKNSGGTIFFRRALFLFGRLYFFLGLSRGGSPPKRESQIADPSDGKGFSAQNSPAGTLSGTRHDFVCPKATCGTLFPV